MYLFRAKTRVKFSEILSQELLEDNNRLRDANGRLTISYGKLKTDYNQIVDDLRTLKNKYNTFKVDHAKTEARLRQFQSESQDYEREINELSHRYKLLNELKDKITQGIDSFIIVRFYFMGYSEIGENVLLVTLLVIFTR